VDCFVASLVTFPMMIRSGTFLLLVPYLCGLLASRVWKGLGLRPILSVAFGYVILLAMFQPAYLYFLIFDNHFYKLELFSFIFFMVIIAISVISFIIGIRKDVPRKSFAFQVYFKKFLRHNEVDKETFVYWLLVMTLIAFQLYKSVVWQYADDDDSYYLAEALHMQVSRDVMHKVDPYTGLSTGFNTRHFLASYTAFAAVLSNLAGIHVAIFAHTLFPPIVILMHYSVIVMVLSQFAKNCPKILPVGLILINLLTIFGNATIYTPETFLLTRTWQGKSLLANVLIPFEFLVILLIDKKCAGGYAKTQGSAHILHKLFVLSDRLRLFANNYAHIDEFSNSFEKGLREGHDPGRVLKNRTYGNTICAILFPLITKFSQKFKIFSPLAINGRSARRIRNPSSFAIEDPASEKVVRRIHSLLGYELGMFHTKGLYAEFTFLSVIMLAGSAVSTMSLLLLPLLGSIGIILICIHYKSLALLRAFGFSLMPCALTGLAGCICK